MASSESVSHGRADLGVRFSSATPARATALRLHILYKAAGNPNAKPSPIRRLLIALPSGTHFDGTARARCLATDVQLMVLGPAACPPESRVGSGTLTVDTGFGTPIDPVATDATLFNTGEGFVEVVTQQDTDRPLGTDRVHVSGHTLSATPPSIPGGPPDGQTAVRQIDFFLDAPQHRARAYFTTPGTCPRGGMWTSLARFTFADGVTDAENATTPCRRLASAPHRRAPRPPATHRGRRVRPRFTG